jgi:hypothetical protein
MEDVQMSGETDGGHESRVAAGSEVELASWATTSKLGDLRRLVDSRVTVSKQLLRGGDAEGADDRLVQEASKNHVFDVSTTASTTHVVSQTMGV